MSTTNVSREDFLACTRPYQGQLKALKAKQYSDVIDSQGQQYIDLVLEGGGTLGIALLGYIHVLEEAGLRFIGIGGTSAGAVSAVALAAAAKPSESRMKPLMEILANMPMSSFVDGKEPGDTDAIEALNAWMKGRNLLVKTWKTAQVLDNLHEIHALNRGETFFDWMSALMRGFNGGKTMTTAALRERMHDLPPLWVCDSALDSDYDGLPVKPYTVQADGRRVLTRNPNTDYLCVIAADISTESKVEFPKHAPLYWQEPEQVDVANFARASMSIPGFFETYQIDSLPLEHARPLWREAHPYRPARAFEGEFLPKRHHFVDGGVLSNFPINAFHNPSRVPLRPTFGVKLQWDEYRHDIKTLIDVVTQSFNSARHALDSDFIHRNPDFSKLVAFIDTQDVNWLDFDMPRETKLRLFEMGVQSAINFLEGFDWPRYKEIRRLMLKASLIQA